MTQSKRSGAVEVVEVDGATAPLVEGTTERQPTAGLPLPPGFVNPPLGVHGHLCLDPRHHYQPTWGQVFIHKTVETPNRQAFVNEKGDTIWVPTNTWCDVPPTVVRTLQDTKISTVLREGMSGPGLMEALQETETSSVPRWQYSLIPSG